MALKKDQEIRVEVSDHPITKTFFVKVERTRSYQNVPIISDIKYREDEGKFLSVCVFVFYFLFKHFH
jgi:hypothetical protein